MKFPPRRESRDELNAYARRSISDRFRLRGCHKPLRIHPTLDELPAYELGAVLRQRGYFLWIDFDTLQHKALQRLFGYRAEWHGRLRDAAQIFVDAHESFLVVSALRRVDALPKDFTFQRRQIALADLAAEAQLGPRLVFQELTHDIELLRALRLHGGHARLEQNRLDAQPAMRPPSVSMLPMKRNGAEIALTIALRTAVQMRLGASICGRLGHPARAASESRR